MAGGMLPTAVVAGSSFISRIPVSGGRRLRSPCHARRPCRRNSALPMARQGCRTDRIRGRSCPGLPGASASPWPLPAVRRRPASHAAQFRESPAKDPGPSAIGGETDPVLPTRGRRGDRMWGRHRSPVTVPRRAGYAGYGPADRSMLRLCCPPPRPRVPVSCRDRDSGAPVRNKASGSQGRTALPAPDDPERGPVQKRECRP